MQQQITITINIEHVPVLMEAIRTEKENYSDIINNSVLSAKYPLLVDCSQNMIKILNGINDALAREMPF